MVILLYIKFSDIRDKIIPLFSDYPLIGSKALDFQKFCEVAKLIEKKAHLTSEGLKEIVLIKKEMNRGRS